MKLEETKLINQENKMHVLSDYMGKKGLVIFFYPMANSVACSIEAKAFSKNAEEIRGLGFNLLGVSKSSIENNKKFKTNHNFSFDLITDKKLVFAKHFAATRLLSFLGTKRLTVILDQDYQEINRWQHASITSNADDVVTFLNNYNSAK